MYCCSRYKTGDVKKSTPFCNLIEFDFEKWFKDIFKTKKIYLSFAEFNEFCLDNMEITWSFECNYVVKSRICSGKTLLELAVNYYKVEGK